MADAPRGMIEKSREVLEAEIKALDQEIADRKQLRDAYAAALRKLGLKATGGVEKSCGECGKVSLVHNRSLYCPHCKAKALVQKPTAASAKKKPRRSRKGP